MYSVCSCPLVFIYLMTSYCEHTHFIELPSLVGIYGALEVINITVKYAPHNNVNCDIIVSVDVIKSTNLSYYLSVVPRA